MKSIHERSSCAWNITRVSWENDSPRPPYFDNWHVTTEGSMKPSQEIHIYYHRPPDRTDLFIQRLIHDDPWVKITFAQGLTLARPLEIGGEIVLEEGADAVWFTFPGEWHDIGRFHLADGTLTGIYANILIPCTFEPGGVWHTTDLFLDLWIPVLGGRWDPDERIIPEVLDSNELKKARDAGWIPYATAQRAHAEVERLLTAARHGTWPPPSVREWTRERVLRVHDLH